MKLKNIFPFFILIVTGMVLVSFSLMKLSTEQTASVIPDNIKTIIDKSCFGCHNTDAQNPKPIEKLDFKVFDTLSKTDMISKLNKIYDVVTKGDMPPKKFLDKFPDKKLTPDEQELVGNWAKREIKNLMKNKK